jgi:uncharacterized membrane protein (Fun14 family)
MAPDAVEKTIDKLKPYLVNITFGGVMGYCSGVAMKKIGKAVAFVVGIAAIVGQGLVATGYIDIDWAKIQYDAKDRMDLVRTKNVIWMMVCVCVCVCV